MPLLRSAADKEKEHEALLAEADTLRTKLDDYDREFSSLKNQDATIRRLQQQLKESDAKADAAAAQAEEVALGEQEERWADQLAAVKAEAADRESALSARVARAEEESRRAARAHSDAQEAVFEQRATFDQMQAAAAAEADALRAEAEEARAKYVTLERAHAALEARLAPSAAPSATERAREDEAARQDSTRREELLASRELQLARTSAELAASERRASAAEERAAAERASAAADATALRAQLESRPTAEAHAALVHELSTLRLEASSRAALTSETGDELTEAGGAPQAAELLAAAGHVTTRASSGGLKDGGASRQMGSLLAANAQRLQAELAVAHAQVAALERDLDASRASEAHRAAQISEQTSAISALEDALLNAQRQSTAGAAATKQQQPGFPQTPAPPSGRSAGANVLSAVMMSGGGGGDGGRNLTPSTPAAAEDLNDDALRLVVVQRERARRQAEDLEAENRRQQDLNKTQQSEIRKLHADNLRLFEKAKFLEAAAGGGGGSAGGGGGVSAPVGRNSIAEASVEGRYAKIYEDKVNPFAAFHRKEKQRQYANLNPAEKVVLNFAKFVAANKHARYFLIGYIVCMHLLVSGAMYAASHHC